MLLADGHLWMVPKLSWRIQHTAHTQICCRRLQFSITFCTPHRYTHGKILGFMDGCRFISPLTVLSEILSDWNSLSQTHTHKGRLVYFTCSSVQQGARCTSTCQLPLWASWSAVHQEVRCCRSHNLSRGVIPSDPSQCTGSLRAPLGAQHNKSGNQPSE